MVKIMGQMFTGIDCKVLNMGKPAKFKDIEYD